MFTHIRLITLCLVICGAANGCSDGKPSLSPVSGRVMIDGQPVSHGFIQVMPAGFRPANGKLDENGHFELTTFELGDGCVNGSHRLTITAFELLPGKRQKWYAPKSYSTPGSSGLSIEVNGPTTDEEINLTWGGGKPFIESFAGRE